MARTLHLLVWITVMSASAHTCKHASYASPERDSRHHYDYPSQEPIQIPDNRAFQQMNTRSADISPASYSSNIPDDVTSVLTRIAEQTATRTENEHKVLSWKPYPESRRGQNTDKIVFPGPTNADEFELEIPEHCKGLGFCEDIPNYPEEQAKKVISELSALGKFQDDKLDLPDVPDITQRVGPQEENIELCQFEERVVYPKAAIDPYGKWHVVLNEDLPPRQGFKVEICKQDLSKCSEITQFVDGYQGRCKQKYAYRKMSVLLKNGTNADQYLKVPSCCSCVARLVFS